MPSDEWDAKARELLDEAYYRLPHALAVQRVAAFSRAIDTAAERRGIERAAKEAERYGGISRRVWTADVYRVAATQIAAAIRALAPPMADAGQTEPAGEKKE